MICVVCSVQPNATRHFLVTHLHETTQFNEDMPLPEAERIAYFIAGFLSKTPTEKEHDELNI